MKRNTAALICVLALVAAIAGLDLLAALLPQVSPKASPAERETITAVLSDHTGQLLILLASIGTAAVMIRQQGGHFFDDDDDPKGPKP